MFQDAFRRIVTTVLLLFVVLPFSVAGDESRWPLEMDGDVANAIYAATRAFRGTKQDLKCFEVIVERKENGLRVDFVPRTIDKHVIYLGGATDCGYGVSYEINARGKIEKWSYAR